MIRVIGRYSFTYDNTMSAVFFRSLMVFESVLCASIVVGAAPGATSCACEHMYGRHVTAMYCTSALLLMKYLSSVGICVLLIFSVCFIATFIHFVWSTVIPLNTKMPWYRLFLNFELNIFAVSSSS